MKKSIVAIVGNGPTRVYAPFGNPEIEIWTMNNHAFLWEKIPDANFEMHPDVLEAKRYSDGYKEWLRQPHPFPIYMHEVIPEIPSSVEFPIWATSLDRFVKSMVIKGEQPIKAFYTSTFPYCLSLAILRKYPRIELYGVDLNKEEHVQHRDAVFFWLGIAASMGRQIVIHPESPIMTEEVYPLTHKPREFKRKCQT